jgi:hypothetical protein
MFQARSVEKAKPSVYLLLVSCLDISSTMMMEAICFSETSLSELYRFKTQKTVLFLIVD